MSREDKLLTMASFAGNLQRCKYPGSHIKENGQREYALVMEVTGSYGFPKGHQEGNHLKNKRADSRFVCQSSR